MMEQQNQPIWAKLPEPIANLMATPWRFSLYKALTLIEQHWASNNELQSGHSHRVEIAPYKELGFPASDVRRCELQVRQRGKLRLETSFLGLYGVDAAMPHYLLEQAAGDEEVGARTRAFLDLFNHVLYCQLFQSWKKSQINLAGIGAQQFDQIVAAVFENNQSDKSKLNLISAKQTSAAGLEQVLKQALQDESLTLKDNIVEWEGITEAGKLGSKQSGFSLGGNGVLGKRVLVTGNRICIELGPMDEAEAQLYEPGGVKAKRLSQLLNWHTSTKMNWQLLVQINRQAREGTRLGAGKLGISCAIGKVNARVEKKIYSQSQF
ncbi:type VI secretion system baseplate subunit TssG [Pseudoalteromonas piscicida]|uniref:type VI secretion system baseplate subunit TssG n=1 Tax=Pseudoalteromonas piscicida TaxID=43662 RepID=UPI0032BF87A8